MGKTAPMPAHNFAQDERSLLCDLFEQVGPDAPTLCEGWTTKDLAAHLLIRERRPDAALGILAPPFATHGERVRKAATQTDWAKLIGQVRSGPPMLSVFGLPGVDRIANTMEYFIHHEDVLRAQTPALERQISRGLEEELWNGLRRISRLQMRNTAMGVELVCPGIGRVTANSKTPRVTLTAAVSELSVFTYGRQQAAQVQAEGAERDIAALRAAKLGI